jgi:hypothetical protein
VIRDSLKTCSSVMSLIFLVYRLGGNHKIGNAI